MMHMRRYLFKVLDSDQERMGKALHLIARLWKVDVLRHRRRRQDGGCIDELLGSCKRCGVEPFTWFRDVLSRSATYPVNRLAELLPYNWKLTHAAVQAWASA